MGFQDRLPALLQEWKGHQKWKSMDYNGSGIENADVLGPRGQFADIWRKIWKLKKALWDGATLEGEQPREILLDLIGHCFLTIDMLDREKPVPTALLQKKIDAAMGTARLVLVDDDQLVVDSKTLQDLGNLAAGGDPKLLEDEGYVLVDRTGNTVCGTRCGIRHVFDSTCIFEIRKRRVGTP